MSCIRITDWLYVGSQDACGKTGAAVCVHLMRSDKLKETRCAREPHTIDLHMDYRDGGEISLSDVENLGAVAAELKRHLRPTLIHGYQGLRGAPVITAFILASVDDAMHPLRALHVVERAIYDQTPHPPKIVDVTPQQKAQLIRLVEDKRARKVDTAESGLPRNLIAEIKATENLPGWCTSEKALQLASLVLKTRPAVVVELGVFGGRSLLPLALACRFNGAGTVYGIDPWDFTEVSRGYTEDDFLEWWKESTLPEIHEQFCAAVTDRKLWRYVRLLHAPSRTVAQTFPPESINILHIDGNHSEPCSTEDVNLYAPRVAPGGYVWFDDTGPGSVWGTQVEKAVNLLEQSCTLLNDYGTYRLYQKR